MTSTQRSLVSEFVREEIKRTGCTSNIDVVIMNALLRAGVDLKTEPSLEETKCILVDVLQAAKAATASR